MNAFPHDLITYGKKIDVHTHVGVNLWEYAKASPNSITTLPDLLSSSRESVDFLVIIPEVTTLYYNPSHLVKTLEHIKTGICDFPYQIENEYVLAICRNVPRCIPFVNFSPVERVDEQIIWLKDVAKNVKFLGIKIHSLAAHCRLADILSQASELLVFAAENRIPILLHGEVRYPDNFDVLELDELVNKFPEINFCIAHLCMFSQAFFDLFKERRPNLYSDISPFYRLCDEAIEGNLPRHKLRNLDYNQPKAVFDDYFAANPDHLLFGTDYPYCNKDYRAEASFLETLDDKVALQIASINTIRYLSYT